MSGVKLVTSAMVASIICFMADKLDANHASFNCRISEFYCKTGRCISADKVCNGADDCGDKSDELPYCTPCNRTYFGDVGRTYELEIRRPREDRLPFLCFLNFTAAGGPYGDLVQITFDAFTVGKFVSYIVDGCPDGYMTIQEKGLPNIGGQWCGSAWGYTVYYSESASLNLTLLLTKLSDQGIGYNFDFKITFKYIRKTDAHLRYGNSSVSSWRGNLVASTYCDRILEQCETRTCRIQSPNYPGIYPRNVTCYYRVEVRETTRGRHPLVAVSQRHAHKIHIKDQFVKYDRSQRMLRVWDQCNVIQDYLTVYDGASTEDPVLVRLCGGGAIPDIISSGSHMLLEFHTSPYDNPFHPVPLSYLPGFELDVEILYLDSESLSYVQDKTKCQFVISSMKGTKNWGYLESPAHSLPPNTTCRYYFQGRKNQNVWLSFIKYHAASWDPNSYMLQLECNAKLTILDGPTRAPNGQQVNATVIGEFCKDEQPKLCDHALLRNRTRVTRPCTLAESYVSTGSELTLDIELRRGSVLFPLNFQLRYEFVDTSLEGVPLPDSSNVCHRIFASADSQSLAFGKFYSPRSVFHYGRGGSKNLSCVFKFKPSNAQKVQLRFTSAKFGDRPCNTLNDTRTGRLRCVYDDSKNSNQSRAEIWISEYVWKDVPIPRSCICSELKEPYKILSLVASVLEVTFTVTNMNMTEDFENIFFDGEYHFIKEMSPTDSEICLKNQFSRKIQNFSGEISNKDPKLSSTSFINEYTIAISETAKLSLLRKCGNYPWLIEPDIEPFSFLFLKTKGYELKTNRWPYDQCSTKSRIVIYSGLDPRNPRIICPINALDENSPHVVELFSDGWNGSVANVLNAEPISRSFIVEFLNNEFESLRFSVSWLQVSKRPFHSSLVLECPFRCPELNACISSTLWCDKTRHCPSGFDESDINCFQFTGAVLYIGLGGGLLILLTVLILCTSWCKYRQHRKEAHEAEKQTARSNLHSNNIGQNGDIYCKRYSVNSNDLYLDSKDSLC